MNRSARLSRYWWVFPPLMLTSQLIFYHIKFLSCRRCRFILKYPGWSDHRTILFSFSGMCILTLPLQFSGWVRLLPNILLIAQNLKAHNDQFSGNWPFIFLLSHRSLHAQNLPESLHCWFTRMSSIFTESTPGSATDKYLS